MAYQLLNPITLIFIAVLTLLARLAARIAWAPLFVPPPNPCPPWQCRISDIYILLYQLALSGWLTYEPDDEFGPAVTIGGLTVLWTTQGLWWYWGVQALSWLKVTDSLRRAVVMGAVVPLVHGWVLLACAISVLAAPLLVVPLVVELCLSVVFRRIAAWIAKPPTADSNKNPDWKAVGWAVCLLLLIGSIPTITAPMWLGYSIPPLYYKIQLRRFRNEMKWTADIPAIQAWLAKAKLKAPGTNYDLNADEAPQCVKNITGRLLISRENTLVFIFGSGFGHWGLEVAPRGSHKPEWSLNKYSLPLADGAWVWSDDH